MKRRSFFGRLLAAVAVTRLADPAPPKPSLKLSPLAPQAMFGVFDVKPITNIPPGARLRLRMRPNTFVTAVTIHQARDTRGVVSDRWSQEWLVMDHGDHWELDHLQAQNLRV